MKPLIEHLSELRKRVIIILFFLIAFFVLGIIISPYVIKTIINDFAGKDVELVSLTPLEFISTQLKVGLYFSVFLTIPLLLYHLAGFLKPAAKRKELVMLRYILPVSLMLFLAGIFFAYKFLLKITLSFLASLSSMANVQNVWSINGFISFIMLMCVALGIIFQIPLIMLLLNTFGIITRKMLSEKRRYVYVIIFIIAAIATPTLDVFTQLLFALPMIVLYELTILFMWLFRL